MGNYVFKVMKMFYDYDKTLGSIYCYVYRLHLPLQTYLLTDKWVTVQKCLRTSLGTPLCILFHFLLTY